MKKVLAVSCLLCLALVAVSSAQAQDFKGFYVGGNVGGTFGNSNAHTSTIFSPIGYFAITSPPAINAVGVQHPDPGGFTGGGQVGYNFQFSQIVMGGEFDFGAMNLAGLSYGSGVYPCCAPTTFAVQQSVKTDWLMTARARVGVTHGRVLVYGTGGLATTNINYQARFSDTWGPATENGGVKKDLTGWVAGGGAEVKVGGHASLKAEYLYANFGSVMTTSTNLVWVGDGPWPMNVFTHTADLKGNIVRVGFNYYFGH